MLQSIGLNLLAKLLSENRLKTFSKVKREFFIQHEIEIYDFIYNYFKDYGELPSIELVSQNTDLQNTVPKDSFNYYMEELIKRSLYNRLITLHGETSQLLKDKDVYKAVDNIQDFVKSTEILRNDGQGNLKTMADLGHEVLEFIKEARLVEGITGIPTGWPTLDKETNGFQNGDLYTVLARPKAGKSASMAYLAEACHKSGNIPLFISMEMKSLQIARRYFAMRAGLNMNFVKSGRVSSFVEDRITEVINLLTNSHPFYFTEGQFRKNIHEVVALILGLKPSAVYLDAAYLLKMMYSSKLNKWERITEIVESLKEAAIRGNIPIIVSFQLNREAMKAKQIGLEHAQLSDAIGQISSATLAIEEEMPEDNDTFISVINDLRYINIIGGREGEHGGFAINWDWRTMNFSEIDTNSPIVSPTIV